PTRTEPRQRSNITGGSAPPWCGRPWWGKAVHRPSTGEIPKRLWAGLQIPFYGGSNPSLPSAMLAQCRTHGYYRGENCPLCDTPGRFLMKDFEIDRVGRM